MLSILPSSSTLSFPLVVVRLSVVVVFVGFVLQALLIVAIEPVEMTTPPPEFVTRGTTMPQSDSAVKPDDSTETPVDRVGEEVPEGLAAADAPEFDSREIDELALRVVMEGESPEALISHMIDSDARIRIAAANALAEAFFESLIQLDDSYDKQHEFWESIEAEQSIVRSALYEALVDSVEKGTSNWIPYVVAWMPGQDDKTLELLAWASNNHPDADMRRSSTFFVVTIAPRSDLSTQVLEQRAHDPSFRVRMEALGFRFTRWVN